jgi:hypothetical protein
MAAVSIQLTPQGFRSHVVQQELIFFIGSSPANPLETLAGRASRDVEAARFLADGGDRYPELLSLFTNAYGVPIQALATSLRQGGKRGLSCPNLCVDLVESISEDGAPLFQLSDPHKDVNVCRGLIRLLNADWVDLWWMGSLGNAQVNCDGSGHAVWFKGNGQQEVLS